MTVDYVDFQHAAEGGPFMTFPSLGIDTDSICPPQTKAQQWSFRSWCQFPQNSSFPMARCIPNQVQDTTFEMMNFMDVDLGIASHPRKFLSLHIHHQNPGLMWFWWCDIIQDYRDIVVLSNYCLFTCIVCPIFCGHEAWWISCMDIDPTPVSSQYNVIKPGRMALLSQKASRMKLLAVCCKELRRTYCSDLFRRKANKWFYLIYSFIFLFIDSLDV